MENKSTFNSRLQPYFAPSDILDIQLAYTLAKFGHRAQTRNELVEGKPTRYFEHVRRVAIILMDEVNIMNKNMIIAAIFHDILEDTELSSELIEHSFGKEVITMIKMLSKCPKEGYMDRLMNCGNYKIMTIKICDRLDNIRSLMVEGNTKEFQQKQLKETKEKYYPLITKLISITPEEHKVNIMNITNKLFEEVGKASSKLEYLSNLA